MVRISFVFQRILNMNVEQKLTSFIFRKSVWMFELMITDSFI